MTCSRYHAPGYSFLDRYAPYDSKTTTQTQSLTTSYRASHSLGSDGVSTVGGLLIATNFASGSWVESYAGTETERSVGNSVWTEELLAKSRDKGNSNFVIEIGTYGTGSAYQGFAVATVRSWSEGVDEHTQTEVAPWGSDAEYVSTDTFTGSDQSSDSHKTTWKFNSNSTNVSTSKSSSTNNSELKESTTDYTGENVPSSVRSNNHRTIVSEHTPESWFRKDQTRAWPHYDIGGNRIEDYLVIHEDSSGPGTGSQSGNSGPASPGVIEATSEDPGLASFLGDEAVGAAKRVAGVLVGANDWRDEVNSAWDAASHPIDTLRDFKDSATQATFGWFHPESRQENIDAIYSAIDQGKARVNDILDTEDDFEAGLKTGDLTKDIQKAAIAEKIGDRLLRLRPRRTPFNKPAIVDVKDVAPRVDDAVTNKLRLEAKAKQAKTLDTGAKFPENSSQIDHIFRDAPGHIADSAANRQRILEVANDATAHSHVDQFGNTWRVRDHADGSQTWVQLRDGLIQNAGVNAPPTITN